MAKTKTSFAPGTSGNPHGRPPGKRALTEALRVRLEATHGTGKTALPVKDVIADLLCQLALTGQVKLPNGSFMKAEPKEWLDAIKWIFAQVDGAPPRAKEDEPNDGELTVKVVQEDEAAT